MRRLLTILSLLAIGGVMVVEGEPPRGSDEELILSPRSVPLLRPEQGEPWLGISVHKPTGSAHASLNEMPEGVGFVIQHVEPDGPAAVAGLQRFDFLWKINDQLVVNEAQFLVLLHLHQVGSPVTLTFQRAGENHEVRVTLGKRPTHTKGREAADVLVMSDPPIPGMPNQFLESLRQEASIKSNDGTQVRLVREGEGYHWEHLADTGVVIQEGELAGSHDLRFPEGTNLELSKMLRVLIRVYEDAERRAQSGEARTRIRQAPRPRRTKVPNP